MKKFLFFFIPLAMTLQSNCQNNFDFIIEPVSVEDMLGMQSYTYGRAGNDILMIGGRIDGLHRRQPWASFDEFGRNQTITVLNIEDQEVWSGSLDGWPLFIKDQLSSTNMQFYQEGNHLYLIGGYGYSDDVGDHTTFGRLIAVDIAETINAIKNGEDFMDFFRYIDEVELAVTGGALMKLGETFHLAGGQNFEGRYNPMNGPSFVQEYTDAIKRFTLDDDGETITINFLESYIDEEQLHRRDLNVLPLIFNSDQESYVLFSGVFQTIEDIPFLNAVEVTTEGYEVIPDFNQYYNHYHCATLGMYSEELNEMSNVFFGGMSQFVESDGAMTEDINVPFVKTIASVKKHSDGSFSEYKLQTEMPDFIGASAELILLESVPTYENGVINFDLIMPDTSVIGYICGGINSSEENIFWINDGSQSISENILYKVSLVKNAPTAISDLNAQSNSLLKIQSYFNFTDLILNVNIDMNYASEVSVTVHDLSGKILFDYYDFNGGNNLINIQIPEDRLNTEVAIVNVITSKERVSQKVLIGFD